MISKTLPFSPSDSFHKGFKLIAALSCPAAPLFFFLHKHEQHRFAISLHSSQPHLQFRVPLQQIGLVCDPRRQWQGRSRDPLGDLRVHAASAFLRWAMEQPTHRLPTSLLIKWK